MNVNFPKIEEKILKFWQKNKIFAKTLTKTKNGKPFVFFEGPPTANAKPGIHHVLSRILKDIICRYKTMQGYYVERKAGWDTHGLPVELEIEKKLGLKSKKEIEKFGIDKFNQECKKSVWQYKKEWEKFSERIAFWLDYKNAYITYENYYIETIWWILKQIWQKGLLFQDYKVVPYCPRCQTTLSSHEVALGYENVEDVSLYLKFKLKTNNQEPITNNTYFFVWTTTPWTLPGNVALAVHPEASYVKVKVNDEYFILAEPRLSCLTRIDADPNADRRGSISVDQRGNPRESAISVEVVEKYQGEDLIGKKYEPLYPVSPKNSRAYEVIAGDFVSMEDGTGIVHIAPAFGEEDMSVIKMTNDKIQMPNEKFPILMTVELDGTMSKGIIAEGKFVKEADRDILNDFKNRNLLWKEEMIRHDYPFCWRCHSPLLYYAKKSWFIKMSEPKIKKAIIANNQKINWVPSYVKEGRFGIWLQEVKDWALSRERYWGTPLPVWMCQTGKVKSQKSPPKADQPQAEKVKSECDNIKVIGSFEELEKLSGKKVKDPHRPFVDEITFKCEKCGGEMKRVPEVIDCWFDSGAMPFAQGHWPFAQNQKSKIKNKKLSPPKLFPADYIAEGVDQTRGWFYTLLAISTLLDKGPAYKNIVCHGLVLNEKGEKMSKSKGNVVEPEKIINSYGADALRFYFYTVNQPGETKCFSEKQVEEVVKKVFLILFNVLTFYGMYTGKKKIKLSGRHLDNALDKWILARLNLLVKEVTTSLNNYDITQAGRKISDFITDLSTWYIRRSRDRFKTERKKEALVTLRFVLETLAKLLAPFCPFLAEEIYQRLKNKKIISVHLEKWPKAGKIDRKLIEEMEKIREICEKGHALRKKVNIKVRQPLSKLKVKSQKLKVDFTDLIKDELNIKEVIFEPKIKEEVELDTTITSELKEEGIIREIIRQINDLRKEKKLTIEDEIEIYYQTQSEELEKIIEKNLEVLKKQILAKKIEKKEKLSGQQKMVIIDNQQVIFTFEK